MTREIKPLIPLEQLEPRILLSGDSLLNITPNPQQDTILDNTSLTDQYAELLDTPEQVQEQISLELAPSDTPNTDDCQPLFTLYVDNNTNDESSDTDLSVDNINFSEFNDIAVLSNDHDGDIDSKVGTTNDINMPTYINGADLSIEYATSIEIRGPPQALGSNTFEQPGSTSQATVDLPGLYLIDPTTDFSGQVVYLDFDGETAVTYNGPVTVGPFDVLAFTLEGTELAGQEEVIISEILCELDQIFMGSGAIFTTERSVGGIEFSTVFVGGDDSAFAEYGSFLGLAEQVDVGNQDLNDNGFVFSDNILPDGQDAEDYAVELAQLIAHETGHLLGFSHKQDSDNSGVLVQVAELNDDPSGATELTNNEWFTSQATENDVDWYKIAVSGPGELDWEVRSLAGGPYLTLVAYENGNSTQPPYSSVTIDPDYKEGIYNISVPSGSWTYYAFVQENPTMPMGNGYYRIRAQFEYVPPPDTDPPTPNPSEWLQEPFPISDTSIQMSCRPSTDLQSPPVEYYFDFWEGSGGHDSGWITTNVYIDTGLTPNASYGYIVKARDSYSTPNETTPANKRSCYTYAAVPPAPTVGNPTQTTLDVTPLRGTNPVYTELAIYNKTLGYYVRADGGSNGSTPVWQRDYEWGTVPITDLSPDTTYAFQVKARNEDLIETSLGVEGFGTTSASSNMEVELYMVSDGSGTPDTDNPGTELTSVYQGDVARITLRARNTGPTSVDANWVLNVAPNGDHGNIRYNSDPTPNDTNDKTIPNDGQWHYYSFEWTTDSTDPLGTYDLIAAIRSASDWYTVLDDTEPGPNTTSLGDPQAWVLDAFNLTKTATIFRDAPTIVYTAELDFTDGDENDTFTNSGVPVRFEAKLEKDQLFPFFPDIAGENIHFQVYLNGSWETVLEDGIHYTNLTTDSNGIGNVYYLPLMDIPSGTSEFFEVRAVYEGNADYTGTVSNASLLQLAAPSATPYLAHEAVSTDPIPIVLIHGDGSDAEIASQYRWQNLIDYISSTPALNDFDVWTWRHATARPIGFNGTTGNAAELAEFIYNDLLTLPGYAGKKPILIAHSRGGLVARAFMEYNNQGDDIAGLITLGTPHHGSPGAIPDWDALIWAQHIGGHGASEDVFDVLVSPDGGWLGFGAGPGAIDVDRIGSVNLAWDNMDDAISGLTTISSFDVIIADEGRIDLTSQDTNALVVYSSDHTGWYPDVYKTEFGTLYDLNDSQSQSGQFSKIVTFAAYDNSLSDNDPFSFFDDILTWYSAKNDLHYGLSLFTRLMSFSSEGIVGNDSSYWGNDGMVPVQSALMLDMAGGLPFSSLSGDDISLSLANIVDRFLVKNSHIYTANQVVHLDSDGYTSALYDVGEDGLIDHLDLLDTPISVTVYWDQITAEILEFANDPPVLDDIEGTPLSYTENDGLVATTSTITVSDVDDTDLDMATISISSSYINGEDTLSFTNQLGITGSWDAATGVLTLSGTSSVANYQTALRSITYTNSSEDPNTTTRTISFVVNDGDADSNTIMRDIAITAVNDAPVLATNTGATVLEGGSETIDNTELRVTDVDNTSAELQFTLTVVPMSGLLKLNGTTLSVSNTFTQADIDSNLLTYEHDSSETVSDSFEFTVSDGFGGSIGNITFSITVMPINDAPILDNIEGTPLSYTENDGPVAITETVTVSDVDDPNMESAVIQITSNYQNGQDILAFIGTASISGSWDVTTGTLNLTGTDTLANYEAALRSITYENTSDNPSILTRTVSFTVNDGDTDSNTQSRDITITAVNDAPTIGSLFDSPDPVIQGAILTLTANSVSDDHGVASVSFYRDDNTNGIGDPSELLATDSSSSGGWNWGGAATWAPGIYTYLAQATDDGVPAPVMTSAWASTTGTVNPPFTNNDNFADRVDLGMVILVTDSGSNVGYTG